MTPRSIEKLQFYLGQVCTIVSSAMNRNFDERTNREHFVIRVQEINQDGIWGTHPFNNDLVSFFVLSHVISIHNEVELDPTNPEHAAMIKEYEQKTGKKIEGDLKPKGKVGTAKPVDLLPVLDEIKPDVSRNDTGDATFVDIASLESLAESTRRSLLAQKTLG